MPTQTDVEKGSHLWLYMQKYIYTNQRERLPLYSCLCRIFQILLMWNKAKRFLNMSCCILQHRKDKESLVKNVLL